MRSTKKEVKDMYTIQITNNTEQFLKSRKDSFPIEIAYNIMFDESIDGIAKNRTIAIATKDNKVDTITLRKALPGDAFTCEYAIDPMIIRKSIESNVINVRKQAEMGAMPLPLKDLWVVLYEYGKDDDGKDIIYPTIYRNPSSSECVAISKGTKEMLGAFFIMRYQRPAGTESDKSDDTGMINWYFMAMRDDDSILENTKYALEKEQRNLEILFDVSFESGKNGLLQAITQKYSEAVLSGTETGSGQ
jgi:hypothetical protein